MNRIISLSLDHNFKSIVTRTPLAGVMCFLLFLSGCGSSVSVMRPVYRQYRESIKRSATIGKPLSVAVGDRLFVKGAWFKYPRLKINQGVSGNMSARGAVKNKKIEFNILKTTLHLRYETENHLYFCAPGARASCETNSSFLEPLMENALIGVLKSRETAAFEWFVRVPDHARSRLHRRIEVFSRPVKPEDGVVLEVVWDEVAELDPEGEWVALYYGGFVDGKVHFELEESTGPDVNIRREFKFNLSEDGSPTRIGVKDFVFEVLKVDNVRLHYQWVSIE